jgi:hypothetical protein
LFDSGATHSFISQSTQINLGLNVLWVKSEYKIATPGGKISSNTLVNSVPLQLGSKVFQANLLTLGLDGVYVILGMDWCWRSLASPVSMHTWRRRQECLLALLASLPGSHL